jgi:DNA-binding transcriptional ArsR family regulator
VTKQMPNPRGTRPSPPDKSKTVVGGRPHERLVKGLSHPIRVECLTVLAKRIASPRELSEILDHDLSNISYHVRVLDELGLIEMVREESVRGAVAHFYKAAERPILSESEWQQLSPEVRTAISIYGWDLLIKDVSEAVEKGTFDSRADRHLSRASILLDSEGFNRLSGLMEKLVEAVISEEAAAAKRMNKSGERPMHAIAATALFSMPDSELRPSKAG